MREKGEGGREGGRKVREGGRERSSYIYGIEPILETFVPDLCPVFHPFAIYYK